MARSSPSSTLPVTAIELPMSPLGQRSSYDVCVTSAITPTAARKLTFRHFAFVPILLQKSAILVVALPLRPLEADSDYSFSHWTLVGV